MAYSKKNHNNFLPRSITVTHKVEHLLIPLVVEIITARKRSLRRLCFYRCLSVIVFTGRHAWLLWGACVVAPGGHAWLLRGVCMVALGGMHGWSWGVHGCSGGMCMVAAGGACMVAPGGACMGYDEKRRYDQ